MKCRVQSGCTFGLESEAVIIFHRDIYIFVDDAAEDVTFLLFFC